MATTLHEKFKEVALAQAFRDAILHHSSGRWQSISYYRLLKESDSVAYFLRITGVKKGDRLAICVTNGPHWPVVFFSILQAGGIVVPISTFATESEIINILRDSGARVLFISSGLNLNLRSSAFEGLKIYNTDLPQFTNLLESNQVNQLLAVDVKNNDPACILYTSGTTDTPKGVVLSHRNLLSNSEALINLRIINKQDRILAILPLHHAYPLTGTMLVPLFSGSVIIYTGTLKSDALQQVMRETSPTVFVAVPEIFRNFHKKISDGVDRQPAFIRLIYTSLARALPTIRTRTRLNLGRWIFRSLHMKFGRRMRIFVSGGAKLDEHVAKDLFAFGFTILEGYGLTETSPVLTMTPLRNLKIGSCGKQLPGVELKMLTESGSREGEIIARGPNIMLGYYKKDDLTQEVIKDGWLHTGDLGFIDENGYVFITGRSKDVIVLESGLNIFPEEIEATYGRHLPVKELCVIEISSLGTRRQKTSLCAVLVPDVEYFRQRGEINLKMIIKERIDNVSKTLPPYKRLKGFYITTDPLPRTLMGKLRRYLVKERYAPLILEEKRSSFDVQLSSEDQELMNSLTGKKVVECLLTQTGGNMKIAPNDSLELDLGIDSLGRVELVSLLEAALNVQIEDEAMGNAFSVKDLIETIEPLVETVHFEQTAAPQGESWSKILSTPPKPENLQKIDLAPGALSRVVSFLIKALLIAIFKIFFRLKINGRNNVPREGPYILYANHTSYFDGPLIAASAPNYAVLNLFFVGFRQYFNVPVIRHLVRIGRIIPLDFSSHLLEALRSCFYVLNRGKNVCVFPEGLRTLDGDIHEFKKGFGILVKESSSKIVPIAIEGAFAAWPRTRRFPTLHPICVSFGKALEAAELIKRGHELGAQDDYQAINLAAQDTLRILHSTQLATAETAKQ